MSDHVFAFAIGDMAKATGVSTPTIRFYESIGLLPEPVRSQARQRVYSAADVDRLTFVRRCRDFWLWHRGGARAFGGLGAVEHGLRLGA